MTKNDLLLLHVLLSDPPGARLRGASLPHTRHHMQPDVGVMCLLPLPAPVSSSAKWREKCQADFFLFCSGVERVTVETACLRCCFLQLGTEPVSVATALIPARGRVCDSLTLSPYLQQINRALRHARSPLSHVFSPVKNNA